MTTLIVPFLAHKSIEYFMKKGGRFISFTPDNTIIFLSRAMVFHKLTCGLLLFPDNDGGEIMHLSINGREIGKNPFIGHAHPLHQGGLVEKV